MRGGKHCHRHGHINVGLGRVETKPHIPVTPHLQVSSAGAFQVYAERFGQSLHDLVVSIGAAGFRIECDGHHVRLHALQFVNNWKHIRVHARLAREDISRVEAQTQMPYVLALPAVIAPEALGLPFAAHSLELLDVLGILLAGIHRREIVLQLRDAHFHVAEEALVEQLDKIAEHTPRTAFGLVVLILRGDTVVRAEDVVYAEEFLNPIWRQMISYYEDALESTGKVAEAERKWEIEVANVIGQLLNDGKGRNGWVLETVVIDMLKKRLRKTKSTIKKKIDHNVLSPRTIQRIRKKHSLARLPKRAPVQSYAKRFLQDAKEKIKQVMATKNHLGALRLSWDIANMFKIPISASTVLRLRHAMAPKPSIEIIRWRFFERKHPHSLWHGDIMKFEQSPPWNPQLRQFTLLDDYSRAYIFCALTTHNTMCYTIQCLINAIRQWKIIPKALLFDNGAEFKGNLLSTFCTQLGITIIYATPYHPQTNGKLERAFRDDRRDFYARRAAYSIESLQNTLPEYVYYRNYQRGHHALQGKPAHTRLREQDRFALPSIINRLEEYAVHEINPRIVSTHGYIRLFNRLLYVGKELNESHVRCFETLDGLLLKHHETTVGILPEYYEYRSLCNRFCQFEIPAQLTLQHDVCPRIAVAQ